MCDAQRKLHAGMESNESCYFRKNKIIQTTNLVYRRVLTGRSGFSGSSLVVFPFMVAALVTFDLWISVMGVYCLLGRREYAQVRSAT